MLTDASRAQIRAADPDHSTWLAANAGSGKTRVLTDRVARLLLAGTEPQKILCLTYTKAAASEMQNRLFRRLGQWAMLGDGDLRSELEHLGISDRVDSDTLARARRLFARAIETPGGLKIQTIHSFCAALLRRFPVEAQVSPDFVELDDRAALLLRNEVVETLAAGEDIAAIDALARLTPSDDLADILGQICSNSAAFGRGCDRGAALALFGLPTDLTGARLVGSVLIGGETSLFADLIPLLRTSGSNDQKLAAKLAALDLQRADLGALAALEDAFLLGVKSKAPFTAKIGDLPTKGLRQGLAAPLMPALDALMLRVEAARPRRLALTAAEKTHALHRFADAFLPRYQARKGARGLLDFDDLINRSVSLLSDRAVASWVLFRLDGGIDHILVDEAQDTSPAQWKVIEALAEEFTAGEGARNQDRRIFVVGDMKQSIYSFQGADLQTFGQMRAAFETRHRAASASFQQMELRHSFRSSSAILRVVDLTFGETVQSGLGGAMTHIAFNSDLPGRVDLWDPVPATGNPEPAEWDDPRDLLPDQHHTVVLAHKVAAKIRSMIDEGVQIPARGGPRPVDEGDFLVLVQRRGPLFHEIIRACKSEGLAIAGADRLLLSGELAVKDLTALLSFLATPEDDLSLAAALRSPLLGLDEDALFRLAQARPPRQFLWEALRTQPDRFADVLAMIDDLRGKTDFLRPYELIDRILTRHGGRRKLVARLGTEAEDGIDAFLAEALSYERRGVPSLTGFLVWMQSGDVEIKRRVDAGSRAIRVMTVHGAKGLEAPIVILPDTAVRPRRDRGTFVVPEGNPALWKTPRDDSPPIIQSELDARARREAEESMRLLYVAMTRAEYWLITCAAGDTGQGADSWYALIAEGMRLAGAAGGRYQHGDWPEGPVATAPATHSRQLALPDFAITEASPATRPTAPLVPSALGGAKALPGEQGLPEDQATRRGTLLHLLLEHLPQVGPAERRTLADRIAQGENADSAEIEPLFAEVCALLDRPDLAFIFAPESLAEVSLTAPLPELGGRLMQGTIDRLILGDDRVLAIDFKSNAVVPDTPDQVPEGLLRQMGAYQAMLAAIYPGKRVETALLWTRSAQLMQLQPNIVRDALLRATLP